MSIPPKLKTVEPRADELIFDDAIAFAAGFKRSRHFLDKILIANTTSLSNGVMIHHSGVFHYYGAEGHSWTLPNSAAAGGESLRALKQAAVPGWFKKPTDPSSGSNR